MNVGLGFTRMNGKKSSILNFFHILCMNLSRHLCTPLSEIKNWNHRPNFRNKIILKIEFLD